jgi:hypothetical protein
MHIVALAWMFVVVLMAVAEATSTQGTVLGAFFTLLLYGLLPLGLVLYLMGTPMRRRARRKIEDAAHADLPPQDNIDSTEAPPMANSAAQGDGSGKTAGATISPEREKP